MRKNIRGGALVASCFALAFAVLDRPTSAQTGAAPQPFKLGTFERNGQAFPGLVLRDAQVTDLMEANRDYEQRNASARKLTMPSDLKELIARYPTDLRDRLYAIAADVAGPRASAPYVYQISSLKVLPPVRPALILNAGANYVEHGEGVAAQRQATGVPPEPKAPPSETAPGIWVRKPGDPRDNPYLFLKSPTVVTGPYDPIEVPPGREKIDYECEFNVVIGKRANHVAIDRAQDYIFGYTIQIDVSDRGGRGDNKLGPSLVDMLVGKNHDTFAPIGPFIVPKEFVKDPMNARHVFKLNGEVKQDSNTNRMSHNIYELLSYGSNNLTLNPGDLISGGSPAGTNLEKANPRWMRAGDTAECMIEGIGTQTHPIVNAPAIASSQ